MTTDSRDVGAMGLCLPCGTWSDVGAIHLDYSFYPPVEQRECQIDLNKK